MHIYVAECVYVYLVTICFWYVCTRQQEQCGGIQTKWLAGTAVREARPRCDPQASSTSLAHTATTSRWVHTLSFKVHFIPSCASITRVGRKLIWVRWMRHNLILDEGVLMYPTFLSGKLRQNFACFWAQLNFWVVCKWQNGVINWCIVFWSLLYWHCFCANENKIYRQRQNFLIWSPIEI